MVEGGSVRARRPALPAPLAPVAVLLGVLAMRAALGALAGLGLGLRPTLVLCELLLVVPGLALVALVRAPLGEALAPRPLPGRAVVLSLAAGLTLWGASLGLFSLQYLVWPPPDGYLEAFRQLHDALRPKGPADALLSITAIALVPAMCEEALFRGIVFGSLTPVTGAAGATVLQALLFALIHIDLTAGGPPVAYRVPFAFGVGLALGVLRRRTGSLASSALSHGLLNTVTFLVVLLADDPARETDPGPILGVSLLVAGTVATLLILRVLPRASPAPAAPSTAA
jgi:membrane protease YdiL (CAAX protease family)